MLKKLFVAAAAAAAVSVPLAGVAWADKPSDPGSNGNGLGQGGMPQRLADFAATGTNPEIPNPNGTGNPVPPGEEFNVAKLLFKGPGESTPDAIRDFEAFVWTGRTLANGTPISNNPDDWTNITPGLAIKPLGPGCGKGRSGLPDNTPPCP
jgi:hypothetical protein